MSRSVPRRRRAAILAAALLVHAAAPARAQGPVGAADLGTLGFRNIGPAAMSGRITDLAVVERDPTTIYAASATGGLWKSADNGITWAPVFQRERTHSIGAVAVAQSRPEDVWVGTGEGTNRQSSSWGDGVYKSTDGGRTWRNMGLGETRQVARIVVHPTNPDIVFVAALGHLWGPNAERGLYMTTDGGATWTRPLAVDENTGVADVAIDPAMPEVMYAASYQRRRAPFGFVGGGPGAALWKSVDGGRSWRKLSAGLPTGDLGRIGISIYRRDPGIVYVSVEQGLRYTSSISYGKRLAGVYRSDDRGEHWRHMGDWNPRPAYSSRITVDPNDVSRIYLVQYSVSDDSGRSFREPRQSLHGDDRLVWVDPRDSRHLVKADDGGVGISYDRGAKWLYASTLPVSQYYHVTADNARPYRVYGGLQDNGSWQGPSATYSSNGIVNDDWVRVGGGDGFNNVVDTSDNRTVYSSSQYLGLLRVDLVSREATNIRPTVPEGEGPKLGNWGAPPPRVGRAIPPANWNSPVIISPHDPRTIYAGMKALWKSSDRGASWTSLGDRTTGTDRRTLPIMGQLPVETTLSLDDGVSYWPTISALSESPRRKGVLWVGTDDGNLQRSLDGGRTWTGHAGAVPGVPKGTWVRHVETSRHDARRVYAAFDGHQADDYRNFLFASDDDGASWRSIAGDLPPERGIHVIREDLANPDLLYLGTEMGLYVSHDRGAHWVAFMANMPRVPVNDLVLHPRERDLVLATHGRGIWILDDATPLSQLTPAVRTSAAHLFLVRESEMKRLQNEKPHTGDLYFRGENPPPGALVSYWLREATDTARLRLTVLDAAGTPVTRLRPAGGAGLNRVTWNLRYPDLPGPEVGGDDDAAPAAPRGHWVLPGRYTIRLEAGGVVQQQAVHVIDDRRLTVAPAARLAWHTAMRQVTALYVRADSLASRLRAAADVAKGSAGAHAAAERALTAAELRARIGSLYGNAGRVTAPLTADQRAQQRYFTATLDSLARPSP
ncbi:MAG: glycosyl hydrolase [Gemmatimonadetes bacterium]|nr:glycosyl hydrolase [Gemmatimonadota bacterium]